ncbi:helix-turn-helix domain-containing protein [Paracoccus sp. SM22M-07]|uniref:helix-turn-helix domain-containing protein n=1 Tax=Paracoccus sp. SM22M-07 TaxID=1520813 RepID=UPI000931255B|nr:helix-turn-helix transcriptional regulator [Paracoccus sp. SM22M-07]
MSALIERESTPVRVAPRITALREALSLDKAQFADSIEYDRSTLTKVEAGKAGLDLAVGERIAALYGVGLDYIYRGDLSDLPSDLRPRVLSELASAKSVFTSK